MFSFRSSLLVTVAVGLSGCMVPQKRYDEAVSKMRAEQVAHQDTQNRFYRSQKELGQAQALLEQSQHELASRQSKLETRETELAETRLEIERSTVEREDATRMVDQLRGELARAGDHLRAFSEQKHRLEDALEESKAKANEARAAERDVAQRTQLMRDIALALHELIDNDRAALRADGTRIVIAIPSAELFENGKVAPASADLLHRIAGAAGPVRRARLELLERPASADYRPEDLIVRLQGLSDALSESGVPFERIAISLPPEAMAQGSPAGESSDGAEDEAIDEEGASEVDWRQGPGSVEIGIDLAR